MSDINKVFSMKANALNIQGHILIHPRCDNCDKFTPSTLTVENVHTGKTINVCVECYRNCHNFEIKRKNVR